MRPWPLALLLACSQAPEEPRRVLPQGPEPIVPSAPPTGEPQAELAWLRELPRMDVHARAGDRVWAAVPEPTGLSEVGLFTVDAVGSAEAALVDRTGQRRKHVPGALIHAIGSGKQLKLDDVALVHLWTLPATLARVSQLRAGRVTHVHYDWLGRTKEGQVEHAEPPVAGKAPMAYVGYEKLGNLSRGLVVAVHEGRAWVHTSSGHIEIHRLDDLVPLDVRPRSYGAGQPVRAYRWATGYLAGTVQQEIEPALRYRVAFAGDPKDSAEEYFFTELLPAKSPR